MFMVLPWRGHAVHGLKHLAYRANVIASTGCAALGSGSAKRDIAGWIHVNGGVRIIREVGFQLTIHDLEFLEVTRGGSRGL